MDTITTVEIEPGLLGLRKLTAAFAEVRLRQFTKKKSIKRKHYYSTADVAKMKAMRAEGASAKEIAFALGRSEVSVFQKFSIMNKHAA